MKVTGFITAVFVISYQIYFSDKPFYNSVYFKILSEIRIIFLINKEIYYFIVHLGINRNIFQVNKEKLGKIIKARRESLSLKQEDLAEMSGVTSKTIYLVENGKGNPSFDTIQKLLQILGREIDITIKSIEE